MELHIIAHARNGFSQKFGIPRQSREDSLIETRIIFTPEFRIREALRGIEEYSHLWLIWGFSQCEKVKGERLKAKGEDSWSPTVRPPRLGGNKRMGVFASLEELQKHIENYREQIATSVNDKKNGKKEGIHMHECTKI